MSHMDSPLTEQYKAQLLERIMAEALAAPDFMLPIHFELHPLMCIVGALQLSLRHPANTGPSSRIVREVIDGIIGRLEDSGFEAIPEMMRSGDNPEFDEVGDANPS